MANLIISVLLMLCVNVYTSGKKIGLRETGKRLAIIQDRQNDLSNTHREDFYDVNLRLDTLEAHLNASLEEFVNQQPAAETDKIFSDTTLSHEVKIISKALSDEKSRWRREASAMEVSINGLKQDMDELKLYLDDAIKGMKREVLEALRVPVTSCPETVAPTTAPPDQTSTLAIIEAPHQKTTLTTSPTPDKTTTLATTPATDKTTTLATTPAPEQTTIPTTTSPVQLPSCLELYHSGERKNGVYTIYPLPSNQPFKVYCDMDTDGGGWTVFQRRQDGSVNFNRTWADYASGFGNVSGEFWLGNDLISSLTSQSPHELRIDLKDYDNDSAYAKYNTFNVSPSDGNYKLEVGGVSGDAGDSLSDLSGMAFSTWDRDNDGVFWGNCAEVFGAWWYSGYCSWSLLNGLYGHGHGWDGVVWYGWKHSTAPMMWTEMKLRATH